MKKTQIDFLRGFLWIVPLPRFSLLNNSFFLSIWIIREIELTQEMLSTDQDDFVKVNIAAVISPALLYLHREGAADK